MKTIISAGYFTLKEEKLSDGSKVYNITTDNGKTICLSALTEEKALEVFKMINNNVSSVL